jgi:hypothetical protein
MPNHVTVKAVEGITMILTIAVIAASVITAGWFIGSASAHATRVSHEFQITCLEQGGNLIEMDDEKSCVKK